MKRTAIGVAIVLGLLAMPTTIWANGGGGGDGGSSVTSQADFYRQAKKLIDKEQYAKAIPLLQKSIQQKGEYADALNLLGFANRKLGDTSKAITYYTKALNKEPQHLGANEYMGELYLEMNNPRPRNVSPS